MKFSLLSMFNRSPDAGGARSDEGQKMLASLDASTRAFQSEEARIRETPGALAVNTETRLTVPGRDGSRRVDLDASQVSTTAVLAAAPANRDESARFAQACLDRGVNQVIDLTWENDAVGDVAAKPTPWEHSCDELALRPVAGVPSMVPALGRFASEHLVELSARRGESSVHAHLTWTRAPLDAQAPLAASFLLALCRQIQAHGGLGGDTSVVFMDDHGGDLAAACAAANAVFRRCLREPLSFQEASDAVFDACKMLRGRRSRTLFEQRPDLLVSLQQFAQLLVHEGPSHPTRCHQWTKEEKALFSEPPDENVPQVIHKRPPIARKSLLRPPADPLASRQPERMAGPREACQVKRRVEVRTVELADIPAELPRLGDQEDLDTEERWGGKMIEMSKLLKQAPKGSELARNLMASLAGRRKALEDQDGMAAGFGPGSPDGSDIASSR